jgi:predicted nucleotide-binding protein (sugar kinase/HSP70/actin superfamily)
MFKGIKKAVLAARIKKSADAVIRTADAGTETYIELLTTMCRQMMPIVQITVETLAENADTVADVLIAAEPLIKAFKDKEEQYSKAFDVANNNMATFTEKSIWLEKATEAMKEVKETINP